jgi:hypothetical protein
MQPVLDARWLGDEPVNDVGAAVLKWRFFVTLVVDPSPFQLRTPPSPKGSLPSLPFFPV